jgi:hypothetical protein
MEKVELICHWISSSSTIGVEGGWRLSFLCTRTCQQRRLLTLRITSPFSSTAITSSALWIPPTRERPLWPSVRSNVRTCQMCRPLTFTSQRNHIPAPPPPPPPSPRGSAEPYPTTVAASQYPSTAGAAAPPPYDGAYGGAPAAPDKGQYGGGDTPQPSGPAAVRVVCPCASLVATLHSPSCLHSMCPRYA